jgi:hypothetical protein
MSEMAAHMDRVPPFYSVIEKHVLFRLSAKIDIMELANARDRIWSPTVRVADFGLFNNPYFVCWHALINEFHGRRLISEYKNQIASSIPQDAIVDFYFDNTAEKGAIVDAWDDFIENREEEVRHLYGTTPRFESDDDFLPLQAADFLAWWIRRGYENGNLDQIISEDFGSWRGTKHIPGMTISISEDDLVSSILRIALELRDVGGEKHAFYDTKVYTPPRGHVDQPGIISRLIRALRRR